jgi:hypothetical protein
MCVYICLNQLRVWVRKYITTGSSPEGSPQNGGRELGLGKAAYEELGGREESTRLQQA